MNTNKNIVVMCDGTWNSPHSRTNVFILAKELIREEGQQDVLYLDGIGIGELPLSFIIDGAVAKSLDKKIKEAYKFIISRYNPGDDIWLFGFSRGAYTARCVAGMIRNCGLLKIDRSIPPDQIDKRVDIAYSIYRNRDNAFHPDSQGSEGFKKAFSHPDTEIPPIKFLGLWDTVGAYGLPAYVIGEGFRYLELYDQKVPNVVRNACQALAIHEKLSPFEPCRILPNDSSTVNIKETWFPGIHMEVGGGTFLSVFEGNERISKATILWMIELILQVGGLLLRDDIESYRIRFSPDVGPSWNLKSVIFDHGSLLVPPLLLRDRIIPLELDPLNQKELRSDLLYRNGDWLLPFGDRKHLSKHYDSNTYEELRQVMEAKGIRLYNNVKYDKFELGVVFEKARL